MCVCVCVGHLAFLGSTAWLLAFTYAYTCTYPFFHLAATVNREPVCFFLSHQHSRILTCRSASRARARTPVDVKRILFFFSPSWFLWLGFWFPHPGLPSWFPLLGPLSPFGYLAPVCGSFSDTDSSSSSSSSSQPLSFVHIAKCSETCKLRLWPYPPDRRLVPFHRSLLPKPHTLSFLHLSTLLCLL